MSEYDNKLLNDVKAILNGRLTFGKSLIVACSGGIDSIALLDIARQYSSDKGLDIICAHVNHCLRGDESDGDEEFVRDYCRKTSVEFIMCKVDTYGECKRCGTGIEETARKLRYSFLYELAEKYSATVLVAHNREDQAETILHHIIRGSGLAGLQGMKIFSGVILRPFLNFSKSDIQQYCEQRNLQWRDDSTNANRLFTRNFIRHDIMPLLKKNNMRIAESICRLAEITAADDACLDEAAERYYQESATENTIQLEKLRGAHIAIQRRVIKKLLHRLLIEEVTYEKIEKVRQGLLTGKVSARLQFGNRYYAEIGYQTARVVRDGAGCCLKKKEIFPTYNIVHPGRLKTAYGCFDVTTAECVELSNMSTFYLNSGMDIANIVLRTRRSGDKIKTCGGTKSVKKLFIDKKIPASERDRIYLLADGNQVLWIPGVGIAVEGVAECDNGPVTKITYTKEKKEDA